MAVPVVKLWAFSRGEENAVVVTESGQGCSDRRVGVLRGLGAIVKTIGDAVMAVFNHPPDGLRCAVRIHADFAAFNAASGKEPMTVKLGLHAGRCISVTLNDRLDYYGSAANKAARLEGQSRGGDIVMSREFADDPGIASLLRAFSPVEATAELKGFPEPVPFLRITAGELAAKAGD